MWHTPELGRKHTLVAGAPSKSRSTITLVAGAPSKSRSDWQGASRNHRHILELARNEDAPMDVKW